MKIKANCPDCGYEVDDASGLGDAAGDRPEVDSIALCIRCAAIGIYVVNRDGETLGLRMPTIEELMEVREIPEVKEARAIIEKMNLQGWFA